MVKETKLYDLLGISPSANDNDIKKAYRKTALKYHPDKPTGDTEKFKEISEAFDILSNADKRKLYDSYGLEAARRGGVMPDMSGGDAPGGFPNGGFNGFSDGGNPFGGFGGSMPGGGTFKFSTSGPGGGGGFSAADAFNIFSSFKDSGGLGEDEDIFSSFLGGGGRPGGSPFGGGFGGGPRGNPFGGAAGPAQVKPPAFNIALPVSLEDLYKGGVKKMKIKRKRQTGLEEKILSINLKPGWKAGTKLTYPGEGDLQPDGSVQDVVFVIEEKPHPKFKRTKNDLEMTLDLTLKESLLGFSKIVETIDGKKIKVESLRQTVQPGQVIKYPGRGMPDSKSPGHYGDLIINVHVRLPTELTASQRQAIDSNF